MEGTDLYPHCEVHREASPRQRKGFSEAEGRTLSTQIGIV